MNSSRTISAMAAVLMILPSCAESGRENVLFEGGTSDYTIVISPDASKSDKRPFTYESIGRDIYIYGGRNRGTMYGVFAFLENEFGCRFSTSNVQEINRSHCPTGHGTNLKI